MKKIYILDGSGFLYRARHAYPPMYDSHWNPMHMLYGFFRMVIKLFMEKPDNLIVVWDARGKTVRHEMLESYKANRPDMPDGFGEQITLCKKITSELWICSYEKSWYEADDILYTLAKQGIAHDGDELIVYTADKDIKQILAYPNVRIFDPMKEIARTKDKFVKEFGFQPEHMVDYLSLIGDASDNVPWARGIWPKGASDLICKFGTIENIYDNLNELSEKTRQLLIDSKDNVLQAKKLIVLLDVPDLEIDLACVYKPNIPSRKNIFIDQYHFNSFEKILDELKKELYFTPSGGLF